MRLYNTLNRKVEDFIPKKRKLLICIPVDLQFIIMLISGI